MKKLTKFLLVATTVFGLAACGDKADPNEPMVDAALAALSVESTVSADFNLTTSGVGGVTISWVSDNDAIVVNGNKATVTQSTESDINVKLTATATKETCTKTREFAVTVAKKEITVDYISIAEALNSAIGVEVTTRGVVTQVLHTNSNNASATAFYIFDGKDAIYVFGSNTAGTVKRGQDLILKGTTANYPTSVTRTTQLTYPTVLDVISENATVTPDVSSFTENTVAAIANDLSGDHFAKVYVLRNVRINYYDSGSYVSMSILDWSDNPNYSSDPAMNLYASSNNNLQEYDEWLKDYYDTPVDVIFAVNSKNSKGTKWRGSIMAVLA